MNTKLQIIHVAPPPGRWRRRLRRWLQSLGGGANHALFRPGQRGEIETRNA